MVTRNNAPSFLPPPTNRPPIIPDGDSGKLIWDPVWLNWLQILGTFITPTGVSGTAQLTEFGCNGKVPQAAVLSDGTLATVIIALKANGIMK